MRGFCTSRSCGETVPKLDMELDMLPFKSKADGRAGEEKAVGAPPPKAVNPSRSTSAAFIILTDCGTLLMLCWNRGTGDLGGPDLCCCIWRLFKEMADKEADEA